MIRLVISLFLIFQFANSAEFTYPDFKQCYKKNINSFVYFGDIRAVAVDKHLAVAYSKTKPKVKYIKYDPFLKLYLFHSKKTLKPVKLKSTNSLSLGEWIAGMDDTSLYAGNFAKSGDLLDSFYLQNASLEQNSIISCLCCEVYGLGIGEGSFIGSEYIKRFIKLKKVYYGGIGARFERHGKRFVIASIDPFFGKSKFKVGDEILKINGKKVNSLKFLNQSILFSKPNSKIKVQYKRDGKRKNVTVIVTQRKGGGYLSDSYLEKKGLFFDKDMKIVKIKKKSFGEKSGLKVGDRLIQIDKQPILNQIDVKKYLSKLKAKNVQLLFDRQQFQFFVKLGL